MLLRKESASPFFVNISCLCTKVTSFKCILKQTRHASHLFHRCIAILGSMIPFQGKHYWEVEVEEDMEYRVGVAYENTHRQGYLGANNSSWCLRHIVTPSR